MTAMAMVLLVALVTAALTARFAADARMTQHAESDAQLRQLLLAGTLAAQRGLAEVALPQTLASEGADVTLSRAGDVVTITATLSHERRAEQAVVIEGGPIKAVRAARWQDW